MTSSRAESPDRYIGITENSQDRYLTKEEKRMLLNVYGVLRKDVRLSVKRAVVRAADLCGVSASALVRAKKEFDKNFETEIPIRSLDPLGNESVRYDGNNRVDVRNLPRRQPCTTEIYSTVKSKISELLRTGGAATIESVVEAFRKDPRLPSLEDSAIRHVVNQLNLTSCMSAVVPQAQQLEPLLSNWDTLIKVEATGTRLEDVTSERREAVADDCCIVYCDLAAQVDVKSDPSEENIAESEATDRCRFEFYACASTTEVKFDGRAKEEVVTTEVKAERRAKGEVVYTDGIFPNDPSASELDACRVADIADITSQEVVNGNDSGFRPAGSARVAGSSDYNGTFVNAYAVAPASRPMMDSLTGLGGDQTLPFAGILVYGLNTSSSGVPSGFPYADDRAAILPVPVPVSSAGKAPRCRRVCYNPGAGKGRNHHPQPTLACRHCPRSFHGGKELVQHTMYVHTMRSLACEFCNCSFDAAQRLVRHVASEHMDSFLEQEGVVA